MRRFFMRLGMLLVVLGLPLQTLAQTAGYAVEITDEGVQDRLVTVQMVVVDQATKQEVDGITERDITILQDGVVLKTQVGVQARTTNANDKDPAKQTVAYNRSRNLTASGATVGIVVDLSTALNQDSAGVDYVNEIKQATEQWINAGGPIALGDPERIGLFIPRASNSQALRPTSLKGFEFDHNLVITAVRNEPPRDGATDLYDAILAAIEATASEAQKRGTSAYVVVFSDGTITNRTDDPSALVLQKAAQNNTAIIAIGIGKPSSLESDINRLPKIGEPSGGRYLQIDAGQREAAMKQAYTDLILPVNRTAYTLSFQHTAPLDDQVHTFQIKVNRNGQDWASPTLPIPTGPLPPDCVIQGCPPLPYATVQQWYLWRALPLAIIVASIATFFAWLGRRKPTRIEPTQGPQTRT